MSKLQTRHFGTVEYAYESTYDFPAGLPGFETEKRFVFLEQPKTRPLVFMQSLVAVSLCFVAVPVQVVMPEYRLSLSLDDTLALGLSEGRQPQLGSEVLCLAIISFEENQPPTANLLSPIVVSLQSRCGSDGQL